MMICLLYFCIFLFEFTVQLNHNIRNNSMEAYTAKNGPPCIVSTSEIADKGTFAFQYYVFCMHKMEDEIRMHGHEG